MDADDFVLDMCPTEMTHIQSKLSMSRQWKIARFDFDFDFGENITVHFILLSFGIALKSSYSNVHVISSADL